ncbi:Cysteine-rich RLK (RECEPTOR-like protein kinase) 8 [Hibiscus syriacus]|uniref:Cysteine-rich RLK (RECEPTOR-like protein kinase) 8 n=1 Tax=Hibiscus syriacus TaxID=106335 RepID=A0A6A2YR69_HIBSY|nr:Cysteine-rich RLK (RECEPTOR-like protein kinase) 8 [Hibiscus syriacus]
MDKGKKRRREDEEIEAVDSDANHSLSLEQNLSFSETSVALRMMRDQFPRIDTSLRRDKVVRIFKLNTGQDDHGIMFLDDYLKQCLALFVRDVCVVAILLSRLHFDSVCNIFAGGRVKDEHISHLINAGLLTRQLIDPSMYCFAIPDIGSILTGLSQGRKELISLLNRRRYKEMMLAPLEKKRLRLSPLDMRFHLRDLIGSGHIKTVHTPTGMVVWVSKD